MEAKNVFFSYGANPFLENISLFLEKEKITTILGPNGSGKSTLLNLFANQFAPAKGDILMDGKTLNSIKQKDIAKNLAIVHQQNTAPGDLTVENLVQYGRAPHQTFLKKNNVKEDEELMEWAMECTNLLHLKNKPLGSLSGGERQRAWIAMSLAQKTKFLFLDEPTTYLDIAYQIEILELVKSLNLQHKMTIVMVLHDINQAIQYSDRLLILKQGKIFFYGNTPDAINKKMFYDVYGIEVDIRYCPINQCQYIMPVYAHKSMEEKTS